MALAKLLCPPLSWPSALGPLHLAALQPSHLDALFTLEHSAHPQPWSRGQLASSLASSHYTWGLWQGQQLYGHVFFTLAADEAELLLLVLSPRLQGQGIAKWLLQQVITQLTPLASQFFLEVRASNHRAIGLYESLGFNHLGERRRYYPDGETALIYGLDLTCV